MKVTPYLVFQGNCSEALDFYSKAFDAPISEKQFFGEASNEQFPIPDEIKNYILHARLDFDGYPIMFSDSFPDQKVIFGNNFSVAIEINDAEKIKKVFKCLSESGQVNMDLQKTFWSECYGNVTDKFGVIWQLSLM